MSRRDDALALTHMLDYARKAVRISAGRTRSDLDQDETLALALVRAVEVIGEAANRTSDEFQAAHGSIAWADIIGMRHRLIHGYDEVDLDVVWAAVSEDLPVLIEQIEAILSENEPFSA